MEGIIHFLDDQFVAVLNGRGLALDVYWEKYSDVREALSETYNWLKANGVRDGHYVRVDGGPVLERIWVFTELTRLSMPDFSEMAVM